MLLGGVTGLAVPDDLHGVRVAAAALLGVGAALVLDEFALILHLRDVYWTKDGRLSVDAVFLAIGMTGLLLLGARPLGYEEFYGEGVALRVLIILVNLCFAIVALLKGKMWTGLLGLLVPVLPEVGAAAAGPAGLTVGPLAVHRGLAQAAPRVPPGGADPAADHPGEDRACRSSSPGGTTRRARSDSPKSLVSHRTGRPVNRTNVPDGSAVSASAKRSRVGFGQVPAHHGVHVVGRRRPVRPFHDALGGDVLVRVGRLLHVQAERARPLQQPGLAGRAALRAGEERDPAVPVGVEHRHGQRRAVVGGDAEHGDVRLSEELVTLGFGQGAGHGDHSLWVPSGN